MTGLDAIFEDPEAEARAHKARGGTVVGYLGATVPVELIAAAGAFPVRLRGGPDVPTPRADRFMEPVREASLRRIFDRLLAGAYDDFDLIVIPRASEGLLQLYYLAEHVRAAEPGFSLPRLYLLDLLQTPFPYTTRYNRDRLAEFRDVLSGLGTWIDAEAIVEATTRYNAARTLFRCLAPGLSGSTRLKLVSAGQVLAVEAFTALMQEMTPGESVANAPSVALGGSPHESPALYSLLEQRGISIAGEDHDWGGRLYAHDVAIGEDPLGDLAAHYQVHGLGPRQMQPEPPEWLPNGQAIDGTIFYFEENDDTLGWDYPGHRDRLTASGIPSLLLRGGNNGHLADGEIAHLDAFVAELKAPTAGEKIQ